MGSRQDDEVLLISEAEESYETEYSPDLQISPPKNNEGRESAGAITLSPGKLYHMFVSHSGDDSEEIWNIIITMEKRFGIRCMYADRDFQPGKDITDNIKEGIEKSMKILLVLSPSYLESGYCWFEQKVAFQMSITQRQNCLIPLILKPFTGNIPSTLSNLTYIDATKEDDLPARIMEAFVQNDESSIYPTFDEAAENEIYKSAEKAKEQNGAVLLEVTASPDYTCCSGSGWEFKALTLPEKEQLNGLQITCEYDNLRKDLNRRRFLRLLRTRSSCRIRCVAGIILIIQLLLLLYIAMYLLVLNEMFIETILNIQFWLLGIWGIIVVTVVSIPCCVLQCQCRDVKFQKGSDICWRHSERFYKQKKCFILYDLDSSTPRLKFIHYDTEKCKDYLISYYQKRNPAEKNYEEAAYSAIEAFLRKSNQRLVNWKLLPTSFMNRHNSFRQKACLCQLVIDEIII